MPQTERPLPPVQETGFRGMNATTEFPVPVGFVSLAENFFLKGRVWKMRPGIIQAGAQLFNSNVQMIAHFQELDGTAHTVAICNGDLYTYSWSGDAWTLVDLSAAGITLSLTADCDWAISRGRLIVTDGVNRPFMWNPDTSTFTTLTLAPISTGVAIYYDKVFFFGLTGANGNVFEWSDEGDPVNGYSGVNQDWQFAQTDAGNLTAMAGLNEIMTVFKEDSISLLKGAVEDTFQTDAVREGISETEGTPGRRTVVVVDGDVYYLAKDGPRVLIKGFRHTPLDVDADSVDILGPNWDEFDSNKLDEVVSFYDKKRRHIVWIWPFATGTRNHAGLLYAIDEGSWSKVSFAVATYDFTATAAVEDDDGNELVMMGTEVGHVNIYGDEANTDDDGVDYTARLRSRQYGSSISIVQKRIVQLDLLLNILSENFTGKLRPYIDQQSGASAELASKLFGFTTTGKKRYRRAFNHVGYTVGWDLLVSAQDGQCEVHAAITSITTTGAHASNG